MSLSITWKLYAPIHCCNLLLIWPGCDCIPGIGTLFWQGFGILGIWYLHINWGPSVYSIVVGTSAPTLLLFVSSSSVWVSINIICACDAWKWRHSKVLYKIFIENVNNTVKNKLFDIGGPYQQAARAKPSNKLIYCRTLDDYFCDKAA